MDDLKYDEPPTSRQAALAGGTGIYAHAQMPQSARPLRVQTAAAKKLTNS